MSNKKNGQQEIIENTNPIIDENSQANSNTDAQGTANDQGKPNTENTTTESTTAEATVLTMDQMIDLRGLASALVTAADNQHSDGVLAALAELVKAHRKVTKPASETKVTILANGRKLVGETTIIKCVDCGTERTIKVQDSFQVCRCEACQKKHRNAKRGDKRKEKRAVARQERDAEKALAAKLLEAAKAGKIDINAVVSETPAAQK